MLFLPLLQHYTMVNRVAYHTTTARLIIPYREGNWIKVINDETGSINAHYIIPMEIQLFRTLHFSIRNYETACTKNVYCAGNVRKILLYTSAAGMMFSLGKTWMSY